MDPDERESTLTLEVRTNTTNPQTNNVLVNTDKLVFHPFASIVIAFGGDNQDPATSDSGIFEMARQLLADGYDVHAYNEEIADDEPELIPYNEVRNAIEQRAVGEVAIFGHSRGGGATFLLTEQLASDPPVAPAEIDWAIVFTAYIDAFRHGSSVLAEIRLPIATQYHVNYYHEFLVPHGEATEHAAAININITDTDWGGGVGHEEIDNHETVQGRILDGHHDDDGDPEHDGLRERVSRFPPPPIP